MTGCLMGVLVSSLATPYLLETSAEYGYTIVFSTSCLLLLLTLIVTYFFVAESVPIVEVRVFIRIVVIKIVELKQNLIHPALRTVQIGI